VGVQPKNAAKPKPQFTISKETTYVTEPLTPDGDPDFAAAISGSRVLKRFDH
jgi:hypothetical protein